MYLHNLLNYFFTLSLYSTFIFSTFAHAQFIKDENIYLDLTKVGANYFNHPTYEYPFEFKKNTTLYSELIQQYFSGQEINEILKAASSYTNLSRISAGTRYRLISDLSPSLRWSGIEFKLSPTQFLKIEKSHLNNNWISTIHQKEIKIRLVSFTGKIDSSLWQSAEDAQMSRELIANFAEVFAWQIDFTRQVNENDTWRIVVEQLTSENEVVGWGKILAAEYNTPTKLYDAYYYEKPNQISGYFTKDGKSIAKSLLRTPIEFARISSGFNLRRLHPVLGINRPHKGVDYAAPRGTPIRSVGDGKVLEAKYTVGGGNTLTIVHNSTYKTRYLHLQGFASSVRAGSQVKQGQIVGYVGTTGLSTGPHLHFEFYENNNYKDPLKVDLPPSRSIPKQLVADFFNIQQKWATLLPPWPRTIASVDSGHNSNSNKN